MDRIAWRKISDLLGKCLEIPAAQREEFLTNIGITPPDVLMEVRALLKIYEGDTAFLEPSRVPGAPIVQASEASTISTGELAHTSDAGDADQLQTPDTNSTLGWRKRPLVFWMLLALDAVVLVVYFLSALLIGQYGTLTTVWGWDAHQTNSEWYVSEVDPSGPAARSLRLGDKVISIDSERVARTLSLNPAVSAVCPACFYRVVILRGETRREFNIRKEVRQSSWTWIQTGVFFVIGLTFYATAIFIGLLKPEQRLAQLACLSVLGEALIFIKLIIRPFEEFLQGSLHFLYGALDSVDGLNLAVAYHFYLYFFRETANDRVWKAALYLLYGWAVLVATVRQMDRSRTASHFWFASSGYNAVYASAPFYYLVATVAICSLIWINYSRTHEEPARRRAKWIVLGGIVGIGPYLLSRLALSVLDVSRYSYLIQTETFLLIRRLAMVPTVVIPFTTAYAILQHRAFDINFVVRRSVQYVLARNGLRLLLAIPLCGLCYTILVNARRTVAEVLFHNAAFLVLIVLLLAVLRFRTQFGVWIDRRFFREQYQQETLLLALSEHLGSFQAPAGMANYVGKQLTAVLHPRSVTILHRERNSLFSSSYSSDARPLTIAFSEHSSVMRVLQTGNPARAVSTLRGLPPSSDWQMISETGAELVVSLTGTSGELSGLLLLGAKQSEEPYSQHDRDMLQAIAKHMAIVYEYESLQKRLDEQRRTQLDIQARFQLQQHSIWKECPQCGRCFDHPVALCSVDNAELVLSSPIERVVESKYRLDQLIGRGGMAAVYRAADLRLGRDVAMKVVVGNTWDDRTLRRFRREAEALASLNHPNIVATYDVGLTRHACAYLVMELLRGPTLRSILQRRKVIPVSDIAGWMNQLLNGIQAAHELGIVHRDLKPENLLISEQQYGRTLLKVLDFGIAKSSSFVPDEHTSVLTQAGTLIGTVSYMSPEQLRFEDADERSDLYSIAIVLIELLTGSNPLSNVSYSDRLLLSSTPIADSLGDSEDGRQLSSLIQRYLADDPKSRPSSASQMRQELIPALERYSRVLSQRPTTL